MHLLQNDLVAFGHVGETGNEDVETLTIEAKNIAKQIGVL